MERTHGTEAVHFDFLVDPLLVHDPVDVDQSILPELGDEMISDSAADPVVGRLFDVWSFERFEPFEGEGVEAYVLVHHERIIQQLRFFFGRSHLRLALRSEVTS